MLLSGNRSPTAGIEPDALNYLNWMNAILGLQRTLMAAERTAVTLIAFGFTVAQVFRNLEPQVPQQFLVLGPHLPRNVGLLMIAAGAGSLAPFTRQYVRAVADLRAAPFFSEVEARFGHDRRVPAPTLEAAPLLLEDPERPATCS